MNRIGFALCAFGIMTACAARTPPKEPEPDPVAELSATVNEFLDAWYIEKDEAKFWTFVSADSTLRGNNHAFSGAFTVPSNEVDPANLALGSDLLKQNWEEHPELVMNPRNQRFTIVRTDFSAEPFPEEPGPGDEGYEWYQRLESVMLSSPSYEVLYHVSGDGYTWEGMATFWILRDGTWKMYSFHGFD